MDYNQIEKISLDLYRTFDKRLALKKAKEMSKKQKNVWTVYRMFSAQENALVFYIEKENKGLTINQTFIAKYENGIDSELYNN